MTDKLRSKAGETFAETLAAILIAALSVTMVATAAIVAARINARTDDQETDFTINNSVTTVDDVPVTVKIDGKTAEEVTDEGETAESVKVTVRSTENGYYYFDYKKKAETGQGNDG